MKYIKPIINIEEYENIDVISTSKLNNDNSSLNNDNKYDYGDNFPS